MTFPNPDIAPLNVLLELFSEAADAPDLNTLLQVALGRLRWVIDFDECALTLVRGHDDNDRGERRRRTCWVTTRADEILHPVVFGDLSEKQTRLIDRVLESGAPGGEPPGMVCVPVQVVGRTIGAICLSTESGVRYTYRDLRLGHHVGQYLGSLISRLDLEEETRRLSARKDELLALLSHELRNPLAPIITAVHLLRAHSDNVGQPPPKELEVIERQAQHLVRLVDDLLDVARLTRGKLVLERRSVEIAQVVARAVEMVSPLLEQRRHSLVIDVPNTGLVVDADENRLAQVLSNLLNNAAHYTDAGGHIGIAARRDGADGETVVIDVSDDGIGIAIDALSGMFDLFVQGPNRTHDGKGGGLGLGLAVVKQLTELHGGSVSVAGGENGRGTKFTICLPLLPVGSIAPPPLPAPTFPPTLSSFQQQRVLVVDDNEDALNLLSTFLETVGHEVIRARDGHEALALFDQFRPSIAVLDIGMPVMDGYELASHIRAHEGDKHSYLVALSGYGQATDYERSRSAGFNEHLVKPVDLGRLLDVIASAA